MPFPWKKTKSNRISRIVSDLQPPSRASSLVVQTGFPTSVVDLFVKNRDRIKRHSLRKPTHKHSDSTHHFSQSLAPPPTPSLSPDNSPLLPLDEAFLLTSGHGLDGLQQEFMPPDEEPNVVSAPPNADNHVNANAAADALNLNSTSTVFLVAAKMFLVLIPVLNTNRLALGITISAFLLFLFEILGKFAVRNFLNASWILNRFFPVTALIDHGGEKEEAPSNAALNNEIQMVESNSEKEADEGLECESLESREKILRGCFDLEVEKENQGHFQEGIKNEISKSARLRAKIIKRLIPKKLRSGKRVKSNNKKEKNKTKQEVGIMINENEQGTESSCEEADEEIWEVHQMWEPEEEEEEEEEEEIGSSMVGKGDEEEDGKKSFECKIVILMILSGLCGGRFMALVLTISGCFMCKFIKILTQKWRFG